MKFNVLIAASIVVILTAWMVIGSLIAPSDSEESLIGEEKPLPSVRVRDSRAEPFIANLTLRGKTEPARSSTLKAETAGQVIEIAVARGSKVAKGTVIIRLNPNNLPEQLEAAKALVAQRELEHTATKKLQSTGYQSETQLAETNSLLAQAKNQLAMTRIALEHTEIKAPFDGVFNEHQVEVGEYVSQGDPIATFLELHPMIVSAEATELEIQKLQTGLEAKATIGDHSVNGRIRYISSAADEAVRTYTVELEFNNQDYRFQAGLTADIVAPTPTQLAHKVSPALLFLSANTNGDLGIKTIDENDTVRFFKTEIVGSAEDGLWISGLPEAVRIITVGQGFVKPGFKVNAVDESTIE